MVSGIPSSEFGLPVQTDPDLMVSNKHAGQSVRAQWLDQLHFALQLDRAVRPLPHHIEYARVEYQTKPLRCSADAEPNSYPAVEKLPAEHVKLPLDRSPLKKFMVGEPMNSATYLFAGRL